MRLFRRESACPLLGAGRFVGAIVTAVLALSCGVCYANAVASFDDILYWIGEGPNQAAVVIDWSEDVNQGDSTVWGYRWDGQATGRDMLLAVVQADDRLYGKFDGSHARIFGLGFDKHEPRSFAITDSAQFDEQGVAQASHFQADGAAATDPLDLYGEGWYFKFWHYARQQGFGSAWQSHTQGMVAHALADGDIDGWTFATVFNYEAYPDPASAVEPPRVPGDYNTDGRVDAADYTVWRDTLGEAAAYDLWRDHYGAGVPLVAPGAAAVSIPEPAAAALLGFSLVTFLARPDGRARRRC